MAHFAKLNFSNTVEQIVVVSNSDCGGGDFPQSEPIGQLFCETLFGQGNWKQASYNGNFRKRYCGIGFRYDEQLDAFIPPQPYASWTLNEQTADWEPPIARPNGLWVWNEANQAWQEIEK